MGNLELINKAVLEGDAAGAKAAVNAALAEGVGAETIMKEGLIASMSEVGRLFESQQYFVPEMLVAARALQAGLGLLKPYLVQSGVKLAGKVAIGTVKGDLHDIGKNLVAMMLQGAGFDVQDLGTDVPPEKFVAAAQADHVDIIALSALLTTTMPNMAVTIQALKAAGVRDRVKVMIGGAPVSEAYAEEIGADAYGTDAFMAARLAQAYVTGQR